MPHKGLSELQLAWIAAKVADPPRSHAECARIAGYTATQPNSLWAAGSRNARNAKVRKALALALKGDIAPAK